MRVFWSNAVNLVVIGFLVYWGVMMVLGPFRPKDKDKK